jgi:hypothetical protein
VLPVAVAVLHFLAIDRYYQFLAVGNWKDPAYSMSDLSLANFSGQTLQILNKLDFPFMNWILKHLLCMLVRLGVWILS